MENLIICVGMFYVVHLFLTMSLSLHKVPFINWTYTGGDISGMTDLSSRMASASDNLRQSLPLFLAFALLSVVMGKADINLLLDQYFRTETFTIPIEQSMSYYHGLYMR